MLSLCSLARIESAVAVQMIALSQHLAGQHVQGREQGGSAVPLVIVSDTLDVTEAQRQQRLGALQRLHLALLIHAQHQGIVRRIQ